MTVETVLIGTARALADASAWRGMTPFDVRGAAVLGPGGVDLPVLARASSLAELDLSGIRARALVLAEAPRDGVEARDILRRAADARMIVHVVQNGAVRRLQLDDLIGHALGAVDWAHIRSIIEGKRILITGGGGSIGGELARRIAALSPARLTLLDCSEHNLYHIGLELRSATLALADIRDASAMRRWFNTEKPDLVFHTAAMKQVPMVEAFPSEGALTNVSGLRHVAEAAHGVGGELIFVSTDKAAEPSGVMGASKRLGELYCQALDRRGPRRAIPVRLGNVLGSSGSVSPLFEVQLAGGGPLTVTDAEVTRYFLSIPQAADSLLHAAAVGLAAKQRGATFVIEMGEALPVVELARAVIRLDGKRPDVDVPIVFTGLRPGEKLHEQLIASDELSDASLCEGVIAASSEPRAFSELSDVMERVTLMARQGADAGVAEALFAAVASPRITERAVAV